MSSSIYKSITVICLLTTTLAGWAADDKKDKKPFIPLYQGVNIGVELSQPARMFLSDSWGYSLKADVNLKNKYFPTLEAGLSDFDKSSESGIQFASRGAYFKIGVNTPLSVNGLKAENMFYVGLHYAISSFNYDLKNLTFREGYWGEYINNSFENEKATAGWLEGAVGVRVQVSGPISLGWGVQYKSTIHIKNGDHSIPPYIPGYGLNTKPGIGINAHLYYKLPF